MENEINELEGLVKFLEPIIKQSLEGIKNSLDLPLTIEEVENLKRLVTQLDVEVSSYGDVFSADIRGTIIELHHTLDTMATVGA
tara:strand:+ start:42 stop:293 length:252 start_codon:yes stop_codon:yes gene_type:complete